MPLFSIIIPTYNRLPLLRETIASIESQSFKDFEIIVVDDGSADDTVRELETKSTVKVLSQSNRGPGAARNLGAEVATGKYLVFVDSDDLLFPWALSVYAQIAEQWHFPSFIAGKPLIFQELPEVPQFDGSSISVSSFPDYFSSSRDWCWFSASSFVIRRDQFLEVAGFHERWGAEDAHLAIKLGCARDFIQVLSPFTFAYREQSDSLKSVPSYSPSGARLILEDEVRGRYPGGRKRARERRQIISRHLRPVVLSLVRNGRLEDAWKLHNPMLLWHLREGRFRYLLAFHALTIRHIVTRCFSARGQNQNRSVN